jgi:hypothetical protein
VLFFHEIIKIVLFRVLDELETSRQQMTDSQSSEQMWTSDGSTEPRALQSSAMMASTHSESCESGELSDYEEFCIVDEPGLGISVNKPNIVRVAKK